MSRRKDNSDSMHLPKWKYHFRTIKNFRHYDFNVRKKAFRNAASSFIAKKDAREYIFATKGKKCYLCGGEATQIDHKISAYAFAKDPSLDYRKLNDISNLFPICAHCNSSKEP